MYGNFHMQLMCQLLLMLPKSTHNFLPPMQPRYKDICMISLDSAGSYTFQNLKASVKCSCKGIWLFSSLDICDMALSSLVPRLVYKFGEEGFVFTDCA